MRKMRFKLICSNKEGSFTIQEDEMEKLQEASKKNQPAIFKEGIVLNWNMYVGIVRDHERMTEAFEKEKSGSKYIDPSPFAKFLLEGKKLLIDKFSKLPEKKELE